MCNACGFSCCGNDAFDGCGCDCAEWKCRSTRCTGCGQTVDLFDDECACWGDDDWGDDGWPDNGPGVQPVGASTNGSGVQQ